MDDDDDDDDDVSTDGETYFSSSSVYKRSSSQDNIMSTFTLWAHQKHPQKHVFRTQPHQQGISEFGLNR